jgi:ribosomal protein L12E/L44/L45/RPP1/RPP2
VKFHSFVSANFKCKSHAAIQEAGRAAQSGDWRSVARAMSGVEPRECDARMWRCAMDVIGAKIAERMSDAAARAAAAAARAAADAAARAAADAAARAAADAANAANAANTECMDACMDACLDVCDPEFMKFMTWLDCPQREAADTIATNPEIKRAANNAIPPQMKQAPDVLFPDVNMRMEDDDDLINALNAIM